VLRGIFSASETIILFAIALDVPIATIAEHHAYHRTILTGDQQVSFQSKRELLQFSRASSELEKVGDGFRLLISRALSYPFWLPCLVCFKNLYIEIQIRLQFSLLFSYLHLLETPGSILIMATAIKNAVQHILPNGANGAKTNGHGTNGSAKRPIKIAGCSGG
jgi:hypothetical protein